MNKPARILIAVALFAAVCGLTIYKHYNTRTASQQTNDAGPQTSTPLPRLLELGSDQCIPCKMMAPILEELKKEYEGKLRVDFVEVWKDSDEVKRYGIRAIPVQIFFDASGKELFRHEGFYPKEEILAKWRELGVKLEK